jgi:hypothetical protein
MAMYRRSSRYGVPLLVVGKKLKLTGGAEEVERVRQKRNDLALKAMFNASAGVGELTGQAPRSISPKSD